MHGLINRSFELFLRDCYGDRIWERVARQSKVDPRGFFLLQSSSDSITKTLIAEASGILQEARGGVGRGSWRLADAARADPPAAAVQRP